MFGMMEEYILENGPITNYMVKGNSTGPMEENTLVNSLTILKMALVFTNGLTENNMRVCGLTDNNTEMEYLQMLKEKAAKAYGNTVNESNG